jgi:hypothetical protein
MKEVDQKKIEAATAADDAAALKAVASSYGAAIYITGTARATGPERTTAAGVNLHMWETDVSIQGFWTETADAIFSNTMTATRGGSRVAGPAGATQTLEKTGMKLAEASVYDLLEAWTRGTSGGVGDIVIDMSNVADVKQTLAIKKALSEIQGVEEVTKEGVKGAVKFTVVTNMGAEEFLEHLAALEFEGFSIDVEDQKAKTIKCTVAAK